MTSDDQIAARKRWGIACITALLLVPHLVNFTFMSDTGKIGTLYLLAFGAFGGGIWFFARSHSMVLSSAHGWSLLAWLLAALSTFQAVNQGWSLLWLGIAGVYLVVFVLLTNLSWKWRDFSERLINTLLFVGLVAALLGLYEYVHYQTCGISRSPLIPYILPPDDNPRVFGPIGQANLFSVFLTVVMLAYFYRYLHGANLSIKHWLNWMRFLPVLIVATVFFLTYSRGGVVSVAIIFGTLTWLVLSNRYLEDDHKARKEFFLLLSCLAIGFLLTQIDLTSVTHDKEVVSRITSTESGVNTNTSSRFVMWTSAVLIFLDHPWLGVGLDNYRFLMNGYGPIAHDVLGFVEYEAMIPSFWAHNEYLQLLCEGGIFLFGLITFFVLMLFKKFLGNFAVARRSDLPIFLYSHLFLFPFLIQSCFEWPLRHPALALLFVSFVSILVSQYNFKEINVTKHMRVGFVTFLLGGLVITGVMFRHELEILDFKKVWLTQPIETTLANFAILTERNYSSYRVLHNTMPRYVDAAVCSERTELANAIIPYSERLALLEGTAQQWYDLARLYLRVDRIDDARVAIRNAFELRPMDPVVDSLLHHLNVLKAARETGRPVEYFYPPWIPVKKTFQGLQND